MQRACSCFKGNPRQSIQFKKKKLINLVHSFEFKLAVQSLCSDSVEVKPVLMMTDDAAVSRVQITFAGRMHDAYRPPLHYCTAGVGTYVIVSESTPTKGRYVLMYGHGACRAIGRRETRRQLSSVRAGMLTRREQTIGETSSCTVSVHAPAHCTLWNGRTLKRMP